MAGVSVQRTLSSDANNKQLVCLSQELYDECLKDEAWSFDQTKLLLETAQKTGTCDGASKVLDREQAECNQRYQQVVAALCPKAKRRKSSGDVGQSDPGTPSKKRRRRTASEIERGFKCDAPGCSKAYGSEGALKMHVKLKHPATLTAPPTPPPVNANGMRQAPPSKLSLSESSEVPKLMHTPVSAPMPTPTPTPQRVLTPVQHHLSSSAPSLLHHVPAEQVHAPIVSQVPMARYSDIPLLVMSIGTWQKRSMFCGDTMARFSYEERKFVWEIYNFNALFARMEVPFDTVASIEFEALPDYVVKLTIEVESKPSFFEGVIQAHKPTTWRPIDKDFTKGEAFSNRRHILHLLKSSLNQPLDHLLAVEPRLKHIFRAGPVVNLQAQASRQNIAPTANSTPLYTVPLSIPSPTAIAQPLIPAAFSLQPFGNVVYNQTQPTTKSAVPPLVPDNEDYSPNCPTGDFSLGNAISDDEQDTEESITEHLQLFEGAKRCQCISGGCSKPGCLCFKSLEACGDECDCSDCSNPLNEEASLDLSTTTQLSPAPIFLPVCFPYSPTFSSAISAPPSSLPLLSSCEMPM